MIIDKRFANSHSTFNLKYVISKALLTLLLVGALSATYTQPSHAQQVGSDAGITMFRGTVTESPNSEDGAGSWYVVDEDGDEYLVIVSAEAMISAFSIPIEGDAVLVLGTENEDGSIDAISIRATDPQIPDYDDLFENHTPDPDMGDDDEDDSGGDDSDGGDGEDDDRYFDFDYDVRWRFVVGTVLATPDDESGIGVWLISTETDSDEMSAEDELEVVTDQYTEFKDEVPTLGQIVLIEGFVNPQGLFIAEEFDLSFDDTDEDYFDSEVTEVVGTVISGPGETETGEEDDEEWVIQTLTGEESVIVSAQTIFSPRRPALYERVGVWGYADESDFIALEITLDTFEVGEVIVRLATGVISETIASRYDLVAESTVLASGGIYRFASYNPRAEYMDRLINNMLGDNDILWAERNFVSSLPVEGDRYKSWAWSVTEDSGYENQAAYEQINLTLAHTKYLGDGVVIAVLDTGIDLDHPALQAKVVAGWDMVDDDALPNDEGPGIAWGHGTHVGGIVSRVAPNSKIMPIRVLDSSGRGDAFLLAYAIEWAVDHGATVINLSLGLEEYSRVVHGAIQSATRAGVVIVSAAGNHNSDQPQYPAALPEVISVTAIDANNSKALFANYGAWVDMAAPGVGVRSTMVGTEGHGFANWSGTSMSAPFVAGAAALVRQKLPQVSAFTVATLLDNPAEKQEKSTNLQTAFTQVAIGQILDVAGAVGITESTAPFDSNEDTVLTVYLPAIVQ